jgi:two-component system C4-dicarboxylate transport sensor histidine kinase DctB
MRVKSAKGVHSAIFFMTAVLVVGYLAFVIATRHGMDALREDAERRLDAFSSALFAPMEKYSYLPKVVATHPLAVDALLHKADRNRQERTNAFLEQLSAIAKTTIIYIMDNDGLTVASSNWQEQGSFIGSNFAFRPYFQDAVKKGSGRFYGMGVKSATPGYYMSHEIRNGAKIIGVAVVKIELTDLDGKWSRDRGELAVTDGNGIIFLSSRDDWKYRPIRPLEPAAMDKIVKARQYDGVLRKPLPVMTIETFGEHAHIVEVPQPLRYREGRERNAYMLESRQLAGSDWKLNLFMSLKPVQDRALRTAAIVSGVISFLLILILYLQQAASRARERDRSQLALQGANEQLEMKNRELQSVSDVLRRISITDHLTQAYTRRFFLESLTKLTSAAKRHGMPLSIIMIDVDNFKQINDSYGHPVGDKVLQNLATLCMKELREADVFARFGGEEFIIALPDADAGAAHEVAERLRLAVMQLPVDAAGAAVRLTISSGISQFQPSDSGIETMIKRADQALYAAKNCGRNQVVVQ